MQLHDSREHNVKTARACHCEHSNAIRQPAQRLGRQADKMLKQKLLHPNHPHLPVSQGRFSFYMTSGGEEATAVGSAAALQPEDVVRVVCFLCASAVVGQGLT